MERKQKKTLTRIESLYKIVKADRRGQSNGPTRATLGQTETIIEVYSEMERKQKKHKPLYAFLLS